MNFCRKIRDQYVLYWIKNWLSTFLSAKPAHPPLGDKRNDGQLLLPHQIGGAGWRDHEAGACHGSGLIRGNVGGGRILGGRIGSEGLGGRLCLFGWLLHSGTTATLAHPVTTPIARKFISNHRLHVGSMQTIFYPVEKDSWNPSFIKWTKQSPGQTPGFHVFTLTLLVHEHEPALNG